MEIRKTTEADLPQVMATFDAARAFMRAHGNKTQWPKGNPSEDKVRADIARGNSYVCVEDNAVVGTFAFIAGPDATYAHIEDGEWNFDAPYHVIHRVASNGKTHGVAKACFEFCQQHADALRIDTHEDNIPMQNAIRKYGFARSGVIYVSDGTPRIAFDWQKEH